MCRTIVTAAIAERSGVCGAEAGDLLLMRPLYLQSSRKARSADPHRRVIHIEYAGVGLPESLEWSGVQ